MEYDALSKGAAKPGSSFDNRKKDSRLAEKVPSRNIGIQELDGSKEIE